MMPDAFVQANGIRLQYFEAGTGPDVVVLMHGYISSGRIWGLAQSFLDPQRFRTIAFNNRGAGESDRKGGEDAYTIESFGADLYAAARRLNLPPFTLVGHSMGGATAVHFALSHPELLKGLVLLDPVPLDGIPLEEGWRETVLARAREGQHPLGPDPRATGTPGSDVPAGFMRRLQADIAAAGPERLLGGRRSMGDIRLRGRLRELRFPVLVVAGDADATVGIGPILAEFLALDPGWRSLHVFHGAGHSPNVDVPKDLAAVLDTFITATVGTRRPPSIR